MEEFKDLLKTLISYYEEEDNNYSLSGELEIIKILDLYNKDEIDEEDDLYEVMNEGIRIILQHIKIKLCKLIIRDAYDVETSKILLNFSSALVKSILYSYDIKYGLTISEIADIFLNNVYHIYKITNDIKVLMKHSTIAD